jgi:hypothetical protein
MIIEEDQQKRWLKLEAALQERLGIQPDMDAILLFIGIRESGLPPKTFTETEKLNLRQIAVSTILVPARYYELIWVDDFGWPSFKELQRIPQMNLAERDVFLQPYVLMYAEKQRII